MTGSRSIVVGLREESWPRGSGYVYWRYADTSIETRLLDCELRDVNTEAATRLFETVAARLAKGILAELPPEGVVHVRLENMSILAQRSISNALNRRFVIRP